MSQERSRVEILFQTLGLTPEATPEEIKAAYRQLALKNHPDQGGSEEEFKKIKEAYEILTNPERLERYSRTGEADSKSLHQEAIEKVISIFQTKMNQVFFNSYIEDDQALAMEFLKLIKDDLWTEMDRIQEAGEKLRSVLKSMQQMRGRFQEKKTKSKENMFSDLIEVGIRDIETKRHTLARGLRVIREATRIVDGYKESVKSNKTEFKFLLDTSPLRSRTVHSGFTV